MGSALFLVLAPGMVAGVVPYLISGWEMRGFEVASGGSLWDFPTALWVARVFGVGLVVLGSVGLLDSFVRFAREGIGTPAPVYPTERLVVTGLYRYVRNPMYCGVVGAIAGQGLLLGDVRLLGYGCAVWVLFQMFVLGYEEPKLRARYGAAYERYRGAVPRWLPRRVAWQDGEFL
ncbi:MAG: isoprenylcysteine carboxylmethyltransferase family protein [Bryobacterales bacterium]|nr:isoprenylcysteine carboxylmethyltransferase family protein [Bryobacterales bacterium]